MKTRNGFVSNSSSSSFVVYRKNSGLSKEEIEKNNLKKLDKYCDDDQNPKRAKYLAERDECIVFQTSVEYGAEETAEKIVREMLKLTNIKEEDIETEIGD